VWCLNSINNILNIFYLNIKLLYTKVISQKSYPFQSQGRYQFLASDLSKIIFLFKAVSFNQCNPCLSQILEIWDRSKKLFLYSKGEWAWKLVANFRGTRSCLAARGSGRGGLRDVVEGWGLVREGEVGDFDSLLLMYWIWVRLLRSWEKARVLDREAADSVAARLALAGDGWRFPLYTRCAALDYSQLLAH